MCVVEPLGHSESIGFRIAPLHCAVHVAIRRQKNLQQFPPICGKTNPYLLLYLDHNIALFTLDHSTKLKTSCGTI